MLIVLIDSENVKYGRFKLDGKRIYFLNAPIIYDAFGEYEYELDEISHWMPLPAPAKISNEELFNKVVIESLNNRFQRDIEEGNSMEV